MYRSPPRESPIRTGNLRDDKRTCFECPVIKIGLKKKSGTNVAQTVVSQWLSLRIGYKGIRHVYLVKTATLISVFRRLATISGTSERSGGERKRTFDARITSGGHSPGNLDVSSVRLPQNQSRPIPIHVVFAGRRHARVSRTCRLYANAT